MGLFSQARRRGRHLGLAVMAVGAVIVPVACTTPPNGGHPPQPNQTLNFVQEFNNFRATNTDPNKRPWFCHALGSGEHQHHSDGVEQGDPGPVPAEYQGLQRGNLSWADCEQLAGMLEAAKNFAMRYPTKADAQRGGFFQTVQYLPGMGNHMQGASFGFNPRQPNTLQYDGNGSDARLIGMSWLVAGDGINDPPSGFPGTNDVWHYHRDLCRRGGNVIGNNLTSTRCRQLGGTQMPVNRWMVHAWIVPNWQYQTDVHGGMHPCLLVSGVAPADHGCWAQAQHDHTHPGNHDAHNH
jgi:hypothetical protein